MALLLLAQVGMVPMHSARATRAALVYVDKVRSDHHCHARARGLHAAYAQCAALRRMLTALRVNRLLVRWRVAVVFIAANERLSAASKTALVSCRM